MQEPIGFTWQPPASAACGKYSMQHALLLLGIPITQKDANKATRIPPLITTLRGVDEKHLKEELKYFGCIADEYTYKDPNKLRKKLDALLSQGYPVILSVEDELHWIVIAGKYSKNKYYWIDSNDPDLIGFSNWNDIVDWIDNQEYYLIGVKPKNEKQIYHSLVPNWSKVYSLLDDDDLCEYWGYYLEDLNEMFDAHESGNNILTAKEFFGQFGKMVYDASCYYYIYANEDQMKWEMDNYRKVAIAHNLLISKDKIPSAIANLSAAMTCIACTEG